MKITKIILMLSVCAGLAACSDELSDLPEKQQQQAKYCISASDQSLSQKKVKKYCVCVVRKQMEIEANLREINPGMAFFGPLGSAIVQKELNEHADELRQPDSGGNRG